MIIDVAYWLSGAEVPASKDASASCNNFSEHIGVLAVVETELELREVQWQIFLADVMVGSDHATLAQRPKAVDILGVNPASHILARAMAHVSVRIRSSAVAAT